MTTTIVMGPEQTGYGGRERRIQVVLSQPHDPDDKAVARAIMASGHVGDRPLNEKHEVVTLGAVSQAGELRIGPAGLLILRELAQMGFVNDASLTTALNTLAEPSTDT